MKRYNRWSWLMLGSLLFIAGCGGGGGADLDDVDLQIEQAYVNLVNAVESESLSQLSLVVSPDFLDSGANADDFMATFEEIFADYNSLQMDVQINSIQYDSNSNPRFAFVNFEYVITGVPAGGGSRVVVDQSDLDTTSQIEATEMYWHFEDGRWKMYGNQEDGSGLGAALSSKRARTHVLGGVATQRKPGDPWPATH